jgi:hypothetical protein
LFTPEAYLTATRQFVAQYKSWSLEELVLSVTFYDAHSTELSDSSFGVIGNVLCNKTLNLKDFFIAYGCLNLTKIIFSYKYTVFTS